MEAHGLNTAVVLGWLNRQRRPNTGPNRCREHHRGGGNPAVGTHPWLWVRLNPAEVALELHDRCQAATGGWRLLRHQPLAYCAAPQHNSARYLPRVALPRLAAARPTLVLPLALAALVHFVCAACFLVAIKPRILVPGLPGTSCRLGLVVMEGDRPR